MSEQRVDLDAGLLTVTEAAAVLNVRPSTLRQWVRDGRCPVFRLGPRALRFDRTLLERFVAENLDEGRPR